jgi:hypothetical protein
MYWQLNFSVRVMGVAQKSTWELDELASVFSIYEQCKPTVLLPTTILLIFGFSHYHPYHPTWRNSIGPITWRLGLLLKSYFRTFPNIYMFHAISFFKLISTKTFKGSKT